MSIYTASEKTELLRKIAEAGEKWYRTKDEREEDIISIELKPNGLLGHVSLNEFGGCSCIISERGKIYLEKDVFGETERMEILEQKNKELESKLIKLQYLSEKRTRLEWWVRVVLFALGIIIGLVSELVI